MSLFEELKDIVALSKETGISLSESINLYREYKDSSEDKQPAAKDPGPEKTEEQSDGKERPDKAQKNEPQPEQKDNVIDYRAKYEELERKLERLQQENASRDVSGSENKKSDIDIVNDITRAFM